MSTILKKVRTGTHVRVGETGRNTSSGGGRSGSVKPAGGVNGGALPREAVSSFSDQPMLEELSRLFREGGLVDRESATWCGLAEQRSAEDRKRHADGCERARREGYEQGFSEGVGNERSTQINSIGILLREAKSKSERAIEALEVKVVKLAVAIAETIVRKSIEAEPALVEHIVTDTMAHLIGNEHVVLKVSSDDYKTINTRYDQWLGMAGNAAEFRIEIDKRLHRGDCIVETDGGIIDGVVSARIDELVAQLLKTPR